MKIKNREKLLSLGDAVSRRVVLEIMEASLQSLDSFHVIKNCLRYEGGILRIGNREWDLSLKRRLFVVGAGKAGNSMAKGVEDTLGDRISEGLVIVKQMDEEDRLHRIEIAEGGHPFPNEKGLLASRRILDMVDQATSDDLFISVISGGSSSLMSCALSGITLEEERKLTEELLKSSARIIEMNAVRRHISAITGGRLAQRIDSKGAEMINLIVYDVVGEKPTTDPAKPVQFYGTPVAPDTTTLQDARNVIEKYNLAARIPRSIVEYLKKDDPAKETPKVLSHRIHHFVLQRPADACEAAKRAAEEGGVPGYVLTTLLEGESSQAGTFLACVAKEIALNHRPIPPPCVLIAGGETTTRIDGPSGLGGPSQELALSFSLEIAGLKGFAIGAVDTDGTDGPTDIAGGITDGTTVERARLKGLNVYACLRAHDSYHGFKILGDEIITGNTGTNLCDLNVIYISKES